jgi:peptidoglycan/xylan/chitin deacetylase (PgdA/CDA1 family)
MSPIGTFIVSLDFELLWGVRDKRTIDNYRPNLFGSREVIPQMLERFATHGVRATWATVGMLFCQSREELLARLPQRRPRYEHSHLSPYHDVLKVGQDEQSDPLHFASSLIREIAATRGQEVATHTFSHYYCLERGQTVEDFEADLRAAVGVARDRGIELRSIVFPRNEVNIDYLPTCRDHGLIAYRGTQDSWMHAARSASQETRTRRAGRLLDTYVPVSRRPTRSARQPGPGGLVDVPASRFFRPWSRTLRELESLKLRRIVGEVDQAARDGSVYHLWWHPHNFGIDRDRHLAQLDAVLGRVSRLCADGQMRCLTMAELAAEQRA